MKIIRNTVPHVLMNKTNTNIKIKTLFGNIYYTKIIHEINIAQSPNIHTHSKGEAIYHTLNQRKP